MEDLLGSGRPSWAPVLASLKEAKLRAQLYERMCVMKSAWAEPGRRSWARGVGAGGSRGTCASFPRWQQRVKNLPGGH